MHARSSRPWLAIAGLATIAVAATATIAAAAPSAPSSVADHGGATRNDGDQTGAVRKAVVGGHARNVILLIGDGMGDSEITSARNYAEGAAGRFASQASTSATAQSFVTAQPGQLLLRLYSRWKKIRSLGAMPSRRESPPAIALVNSQIWPDGRA